MDESTMVADRLSEPLVADVWEKADKVTDRKTSAKEIETNVRKCAERSMWCKVVTVSRFQTRCDQDLAKWFYATWEDPRHPPLPERPFRGIEPVAMKLPVAHVVDLDPDSRNQAAGQASYNPSWFTLSDLRVRANCQQLTADLHAWLDGFSPNVQDILDNFEFRKQTPRLSRAGALGTHNAETYAVCKANLLLKGEVEAADIIVRGPKHSTLSNDAFPRSEFDPMLSNPPSGKSWNTGLERMGGKRDMRDPRFMIGHAIDPDCSLVTGSSDGQILFLANKFSKMKQSTALGSRIAEVHDGSSLFTGDAGRARSNTVVPMGSWIEPPRHRSQCTMTCVKKMMP